MLEVRDDAISGAELDLKFLVLSLNDMPLKVFMEGTNLVALSRMFHNFVPRSEKAFWPLVV